MDIMLNAIEVRVLGSLLEKEMATPEYYPLSLNALVNACNQKSNRAPVVQYDEMLVEEALASLKGKQLVTHSGEGRVPKFAQNFTRPRNLVNREAAILCVLLLRGPQTVGELRGRTERMHGFSNLEEVEATLAELIELSYVAKLSRQPGRKEHRYTHLLTGQPEAGEADREYGFQRGSKEVRAEDGRIGKLAEELSDLRQEFERLQTEFQKFKAQFE